MNYIFYTTLALLISISSFAQSDEWSIIDTKGTVLRTIKADKILYGGDLLRFSKDGKWGYMDLAGNVKVEPKFEKAGHFGDGLGLVLYGDKYGYVNTRNHLEIPNMYTQAGPFKDGRAMVLQNGKYGFIDRNGQKAVGYKYSRVSEFSEGRAVVKVGFDKELGLIDKAGEYVIERCCFEMNPPSDGMVAARANGKYGYFDLDGNLVIENKYKKIYDFSEGLAFVKEDASFYGKYAVIDKQGNEVMPPKYEKISEQGFNDGLAGVKVDLKWGFINKTGDMVIEPQYDNIVAFNEGIANVQKGLVWGYIDTEGKEVLPFIFDSQAPFQSGKKVVAFVQYNEAAKEAYKKAQEEAKIQKEYEAAVALADASFKAESYEEAIGLYKKATAIKDVPYATEQVQASLDAIQAIKDAEAARIAAEEAAKKAEEEALLKKQEAEAKALEASTDSVSEEEAQIEADADAEEARLIAAAKAEIKAKIAAKKAAALEKIKSDGPVEEVVDDFDEEVNEPNDDFAEEIIIEEEEEEIEIPVAVTESSKLDQYSSDVEKLSTHVASIFSTIKGLDSAPFESKKAILETVVGQAQSCKAMVGDIGLNDQTSVDDSVELDKIKSLASSLEEKASNMRRTPSETNSSLLSAKAQLIELYISKLQRKLKAAKN